MPSGNDNNDEARKKQKVRKVMSKCVICEFLKEIAKRLWNTIKMIPAVILAFIIIASIVVLLAMLIDYLLEINPYIFDVVANIITVIICSIPIILVSSLIGNFIFDCYFTAKKRCK